VERGRVRVAWTVDALPEGFRARLTWTEAGGPPVSPPQRRGFGSRLIERSLAADLDGEVNLEYRPEGVVCTLVWSLGGGDAVPAPWPKRTLAAAQ
jgi:two-component sensor histidine kinase